MKMIGLVLYAAAAGCCALGVIGHSGAWAAAALSFFASTMMIVGQQKDKRSEAETEDNIKGELQKFFRYNTGVTPLRNSEIFNYDITISDIPYNTVLAFPNGLIFCRTKIDICNRCNT